MKINKIRFLLALAFLLPGCKSFNSTTYHVPVRNIQQSQPGLGSAQIVRGFILVPVNYGLCAGANSNEVVFVDITVVNYGENKSGQVWFDQKKAASNADVSAGCVDCLLWPLGIGNYR